MDARLVSSVIFSALYSPLTASIVPALVDRAEKDDFQGLFALALAGEDSGENMSIGMQLSVLCSEDASRVSADELAHQTSKSVFGAHLIGSQLDACAMWPRGTVNADYYRPVKSDVPVLVLSGEVDPVTPPVWGESVVKHLSHGKHLIVPSTGHGVVMTPVRESHRERLHRPRIGGRSRYRLRRRRPSSSVLPHARRSRSVGGRQHP